MTDTNAPVTLDELQALRARLAPGAEVNVAYWLVSAWIADVHHGSARRVREDMQRALDADRAARDREARLLARRDALVNALEG